MKKYQNQKLWSFILGIGLLMPTIMQIMGTGTFGVDAAIRNIPTYLASMLIIWVLDKLLNFHHLSAGCTKKIYMENKGILSRIVGNFPVALLMSVVMPVVAFLLIPLPLAAIPTALSHAWLPGFLVGWVLSIIVDLLSDLFFMPKNGNAPKKALEH